MEISNTDFVNSFLKAARKRKLSIVVIYGEQVGTRAQLKMTSNVGPEMTSTVMQWIRKSSPPVTEAPTDDDAPPAGDVS